MSVAEAEVLPPHPDINEVAPPLSDADRACFEDIREVLIQHGMLTRFGVTLLHQHFEIGDDEAMVEQIDVETRTLTCMPVKRERLAKINTVQTSWRLDSPTGQMACETNCMKDYGENGPHWPRHIAV
jgi:hypothetical protein